MYYHTCPLCGANLDPGEYCDCMDEKSRSSATLDNGSRRTIRCVPRHEEKQRTAMLCTHYSSVQNN